MKTYIEQINKNERRQSINTATQTVDGEQTKRKAIDLNRRQPKSTSATDKLQFTKHEMCKSLSEK